MKETIGRSTELAILNGLKSNSKPEFVAVYGRRRVGKTYLIKNAFDEKFTFQMTGMNGVSTEQQLGNFFVAYNHVSTKQLEKVPENWFEAFQLLRKLIVENTESQSIVFLDELPWLDTTGANFIPALEHFWNSFGASHDNLKLIVCGSAASWIINKLINNHGGLHNRITKRIHLQPFTLKETEEFLIAKHIKFERYQIVQIYCVMGGIPFYLDEIEPGLSAFQNIDNICFAPTGLLKNEYQNLFSSLFHHPEKHLMVVEALAQKSKGLTRDELIKASKIPNGGTSTKVLDELEISGFIKKYTPFGRKSKNSLYQLIDPYCLFYYKFIKDSKATAQGVWLSLLDSASYRAWSGYAFEYVCMSHIGAIKKALGIQGVYSEISSWRSLSSENGTQIDLLIDRKDKVITICEIKFSENEFEISKSYAQNLRNKINVFRTESKTRKSIFLAMITTYGVKKNEYALSLVQNSIMLDELFE